MICKETSNGGKVFAKITNNARERKKTDQPTTLPTAALCPVGNNDIACFVVLNNPCTHHLGLYQTSKDPVVDTECKVGNVPPKLVFRPRATKSGRPYGVIDEYAYSIPHPYTTLVPKINTTSAEQLGRSYATAATDLQKPLPQLADQSMLQHTHQA